MEAKLNRDPFTGSNQTRHFERWRSFTCFLSRHVTNHNARIKYPLSLSAARTKMLLAGKIKLVLIVVFSKRQSKTFDKIQYARPIHQSYEYFNDKRKIMILKKSEN
jgi:Holliday junction resolvase RusA-like endonuclease